MGIEKDGDRYLMYLRNRRALIDYATPILGSRDDAEDVVQDAYLQFTPGNPRLPLPPRSYLFRIVRNLSFNRRSRKKVEASVLDDIPWWAVPEAGETPERSLLFSEQVKNVSAAVERLSEKQRVVLHLYRFEELTLKDIAARLGVSVPTVHRLLKDAMMMMREAMDIDQ
ncbi:RNA polymerase sigma factor [Agrobacterium rosae]|uniref:RNA polymerase sigma factor n=1 Tax=Agrobacterium rosae TaxID=1972867 RepID=UPI0019D3AD11|nr:RNA polymerase sigma factor [Agrobacterium rosae]MBN7809276.1 RNA polymerase sigma factor [Agrobacterium rosae]